MQWYSWKKIFASWKKLCCWVLFFLELSGSCLMTLLTLTLYSCKPQLRPRLTICIRRWRGSCLRFYKPTGLPNGWPQFLSHHWIFVMTSGGQKNGRLTIYVCECAVYQYFKPKKNTVWKPHQRINTLIITSIVMRNIRKFNLKNLTVAA